MLARNPSRRDFMIRRHLRRGASLALFGTFAVLVGACTSPRSMSTTPVGSAQLPPGSVPSQQMTFGGLRTELLAFADVSMAEMERLGVGSLSTDADPNTRAFLQGLRADLASTAIALAVEPDPESALLDLMVSMAAKRMATADAFPAWVGAATRSDVTSTLTRLEKEIWSVGGEVYNGAELAALRERVGRWWDEVPEKSFLGVVRVGHLPTNGGAELAKGLFAPLNEANRQIEESRLLGERFLFLAERLPTIAVWQAEAAASRAVATPESRSALQSLTLMATTMERLAQGVDSLPMLMDSQRVAFLSAFDAREETMSGLLSETRGVVRDAAPLLESGERLAGLANETTASLSRTLEATERLIATLRDANAPGGAMSLDVENYAEVIADFRGATEALSAALERANGLAESPQALIDHAAWRAAQLMMLLFALIVMYRFGIPLIGRDRSSGG